MKTINKGPEVIKSQISDLIIITKSMNDVFVKLLEEYQNKEREEVSIEEISDYESFKYVLKGVQTNAIRISEFINEGLRGSKVLSIKQVDAEIIKANEEINGEDICLIYFMEESAEVTKELSKMIRQKGSRKQLVSEIADLYYTLSMLVQKYSISEEEINECIVEKEIYARQELEKEAERESVSGI